MTTGINPDVNPVARRWAAKILGVEENASREEIKRAYLRKLRVDDFLPPHSLHHAFRVLDGKRALPKHHQEWLAEEEARLRSEVESFAEAFFTLSVSERRQRWEALLGRCPDISPLRARLEALKPGLEVEIKSMSLGQSFREQLAEQIVQSFPLAPLAQVTSRQAFVYQIEKSSDLDQPLWQKAARYLQAEWPALASLDKELVEYVAKLRSRLARRSKLHRRSQGKRSGTSAASRTEVPWWGIVLLIVVSVTGIMRGLKSSINSFPPPASSPSYSPPRIRPLPLLENRAVIRDLCDPAKFDVQLMDPPSARILLFTPRSGLKTHLPNGPQVNKNQPVMFGEAALRLMGVPEEQVKELVARAARTKRPAGILKMPRTESDKPNP